MFEGVFLLEQEIERKLENYVELLMSWVGKIRLTGTRTVEGLREHVEDAKAALQFLNGRKVIDVGTGGGLPGIVWAICLPDIEFTLLDSIKKKCSAVEQMCAELELKNTSVVCARAEEYAKETRASFDIAAARAVTAAPELIALLAPFVKKGGTALAFKGPKFADEIAGMADNAWEKLGISAPEVVGYGPETRQGVIVLWKKTA